MRAVDYVTHGFGYQPPMPVPAPTPVPVPTPVTIPFPQLPTDIKVPTGYSTSPSGPSGLKYAPVETKIREYLASVPVPQYIIEAAVQTYRTSGYAGFQKVLNFMSAIGQAANAGEQLMISSGAYKGSQPGAAYKKFINGALNTAVSRVGSNPLISAIATFYRSLVAQVPDSEPNPDRWISSRTREIAMPPLWVRGVERIASGIF